MCEKTNINIIKQNIAEFLKNYFKFENYTIKLTWGLKFVVNTEITKVGVMDI